MTLEWGLQPTEPFEAAWGARAIWVDAGIGPRRIDVVHNRQAHTGDPKDLDRLVAWLNGPNRRGGALDQMQDKVHKAGIQSDASIEVVIEEGDFCLRANPRGSCGYLYLCATVAKGGAS